MKIYKSHCASCVPVVLGPWTLVKEVEPDAVRLLWRRSCACGEVKQDARPNKAHRVVLESISDRDEQWREACIMLGELLGDANDLARERWGFQASEFVLANNGGTCLANLREGTW